MPPSLPVVVGEVGDPGHLVLGGALADLVEDEQDRRVHPFVGLVRARSPAGAPHRLLDVVGVLLLPLIDAAACAHHDGDSDEACRRTVSALTGLPGDFRTGLVYRRALDLYEAIPAQHHHEHAVQELRDALAA
ncbi:hypothetical protein ACFXAW_30075 [Streptomyces sp. NPDC059445]|uniref:hypothetical protein n=1 Tax=Streptomyces sp. NPDC059445 TaxID=3346832 RepID=UPI003687D371